MGQCLGSQSLDFSLRHPEQMEFFFSFIEFCLCILMVGFTSLIFTDPDRPLGQERLGPFEGLLRHSHCRPSFAICQLGLAERGAIEQKKPISGSNAIPKVDIHSNDASRNSWAEVSEPILVRQDLSPLSFERYPNGLELRTVRVNVCERGTALGQFNHGRLGRGLRGLRTRFRRVALRRLTRCIRHSNRDGDDNPASESW